MINTEHRSCINQAQSFVFTNDCQLTESNMESDVKLC